MSDFFRPAFARYFPCAVFALSILALSVMILPDIAAAQIDMNASLKVMPSFDSELSEEDFLPQSIPIEEDPAGDKYLTYRINLPDDWQKSKDIMREGDNGDVMLSNRILRMLAKYTGPADRYDVSYLTIQAMTLEHAISPKMWLLNFIAENGYTVLGFDEEEDVFAECLGVKVIGDRSYTTRMKAMINANHMVLVSYFVPDRNVAVDKRWEKERAFQQRTVESFAFVNPKRVKIEMEDTYSYLDLIRFSYPKSWKREMVKTFSVEGMEATLINTFGEDRLAGEIRIRVISTDTDSSLPQEVKRLYKELQGSGHVVGGLIEVHDDYKYPPHINYSRVEVYAARSTDRMGREIDYEVWLGVLAEHDFYILVTMQTPAREKEFYLWAQNSETFKNILQSFRP